MGNSKLTAERILSLKREIENKKSEISKLKGSIHAYYEELDRHGFKTIKEAKRFLKKISKDILIKEEKIKKKVKKVERLLSYIDHSS